MVYPAVRRGLCRYRDLHGLAEVYPIMVIEAVWGLVALQRFLGKTRKAGPDPLGT